MTETLLQSFCERCGTRYTVPTRPSSRGRLSFGRSLGRGRPPGDERHVTDALPTHDPFQGTFHFCLECRQYTCANCWNGEAGFCQGCYPLEGGADLGGVEAAAKLEAVRQAAEAQQEIARMSAPTAWPDSDLRARRSGPATPPSGTAAGQTGSRGAEAGPAAPWPETPAVTPTDEAVAGVGARPSDGAGDADARTPDSAADAPSEAETTYGATDGGSAAEPTPTDTRPRSTNGHGAWDEPANNAVWGTVATAAVWDAATGPTTREPRAGHAAGAGGDDEHDDDDLRVDPWTGTRWTDEEVALAEAADSEGILDAPAGTAGPDEAWPAAALAGTAAFEAPGRADLPEAEGFGAQETLAQAEAPAFAEPPKVDIEQDFLAARLAGVGLAGVGFAVEEGASAAPDAASEPGIEDEVAVEAGDAPVDVAAAQDVPPAGALGEPWTIAAPEPDLLAEPAAVTEETPTAGDALDEGPAAATAELEPSADGPAADGEPSAVLEVSAEAAPTPEAGAGLAAEAAVEPGPAPEAVAIAEAAVEPGPAPEAIADLPAEPEPLIAFATGWDAGGRDDWAQVPPWAAAGAVLTEVGGTAPTEDRPLVEPEAPSTPDPAGVTDAAVGVEPAPAPAATPEPQLGSEQAVVSADVLPEPESEAVSADVLPEPEPESEAVSAAPPAIELEPAVHEAPVELVARPWPPYPQQPAASVPPPLVDPHAPVWPAAAVAAPAILSGPEAPAPAVLRGPLPPAPVVLTGPPTPSPAVLHGPSAPPPSATHAPPPPATYFQPAPPPTFSYAPPPAAMAVPAGARTRGGPPAGGPAAASGVRPCASCGLALSAQARFCRRCGRPQA